jgi:RNA polymerase sigma-70 factor (ECF subfamily)
MNNQDRTDESLMEEYAATQDQACFDVLYERHQQQLMKFLERYVFGDYADDLFQIVWLNVHEYRHQFDAGHKFKNWLYMLATQRAGNWAEVRVNEPSTSLSDLENFDPADESVDVDEHKSLRDLVKTLPEREREIISARYLNDLTPSEAANMLGTPYRTFHTWEQKALSTLRERMTA